MIHFLPNDKKWTALQWLQHQYIHQSSHWKMEHQEVDLSTIHQPILQSTTVTSETCASITIGVKLCVSTTNCFRKYFCTLNIIIYKSVDRCTWLTALLNSTWFKFAPPLFLKDSICPSWIYFLEKSLHSHPMFENMGQKTGLQTITWI